MRFDPFHRFLKRLFILSDSCWSLSIFLCKKTQLIQYIISRDSWLDIPHSILNYSRPLVGAGIVYILFIGNEILLIHVFKKSFAFLLSTTKCSNSPASITFSFLSLDTCTFSYTCWTYLSSASCSYLLSSVIHSLRFIAKSKTYVP